MISDYLIRSPIISKISLTGSVPVGRQLSKLAGEILKPATMELGGHAPVLVFGDADTGQVMLPLVRVIAVSIDENKGP